MPTSHDPRDESPPSMNALLNRGSIAAAAAIGLLLAGTAPAAEDAPACPDFATAYRELLRLFPEEHPGRGIDRGGEKGVVADHPMTYGLVLSAEALRFEAEPGDEGRRRIRGATRWLVANSRLSADGKPGWGVPYDWGERPRNTSYTITTAVVLEGLLDAVRADVGWTADEKKELVDLMRQVADRWCTDLWMAGQGGGYFCYAGHDKKPCGFYVNAPVMFLGSLARLLHEHGSVISPDRRELFESRLDALARSTVATVTLRDGAPFWDYITPPHNPHDFQRPNDLIHQAYILWGVETYRDLGGGVRLPWTRAKAVESLERFWKDGTIRFFAQDEPGVKPGNREQPSNLWGTGMLLACQARWGTPEQSRRTFEAICDSYGPFPKMRVLPAAVGGEATSYPRDNAHVLFGLAHAVRQARGR
jgi:hypothetical protein